MTNPSDHQSESVSALAVYCRYCASPLVQAAAWTKQDDSHWKVRLWCPECWREQAVVLDRTQAAYLSLAVEEGFACVLEAFEGLDAIVTTEPPTRKRPKPS